MGIAHKALVMLQLLVSLTPLLQSVVLLVLAGGCVSSEGAQPKPVQLVENLSGERARANLIDLCAKTHKCPKTPGALHCRLSIMGNKILVGNHPWSSWGVSRCRAEYRLSKSLCAAGLDPSEVEQVLCQPDATGEECLAQHPPCLAAPEESYLCRLQEMNGEKLSPHLKISAWGTSECGARHQLRHVVCAKNIRPSTMTKVHCTAWRRPKACELDYIKCPVDIMPTRCHAVATKLRNGFERTFLGRGRNKCQANFKLQQQLCFNGLNPARFEVKCQSI
jgi:hypothetical protein